MGSYIHKNRYQNSCLRYVIISGMPVQKLYHYTHTVDDDVSTFFFFFSILSDSGGQVIDNVILMMIILYFFNMNVYKERKRRNTKPGSSVASSLSVSRSRARLSYDTAAAATTSTKKVKEKSLRKINCHAMLTQAVHRLFKQLHRHLITFLATS